MKITAAPWIGWAFLSAVFAALTAIFAKMGVTQINSDLATLVRTAVVLVLGTLLVTMTDAWQPLMQLPRRAWIFLLLSGLATGASWICYFRALKSGPASAVAPIDKLSVVFVAVFAVLFLGEQLNWRGWSGIILIGVGAALVAMR